MGFFIECENGVLVNSSNVILMKRVAHNKKASWNGEGRYQLSMLDMERVEHAVLTYEEAFFLRSELIPAAPGARALHVYVWDADGGGRPTEAEISSEWRTIIGWRVGSGRAQQTMPVFIEGPMSNATVLIEDQSGLLVDTGIGEFASQEEAVASILLDHQRAWDNKQPAPEDPTPGGADD